MITINLKHIIMDIDNRENYRQEDQNFQNEDKKETINHSITENAEPDYGDDLVNDQSENKEFDGDNLANEEFDQENPDNDEIDNDEFTSDDFNNDEMDNEELGNENFDNEDLGNNDDYDRPFITG
jgi:hypothetical protein